MNELINVQKRYSGLQTLVIILSYKSRDQTKGILQDREEQNLMYFLSGREDRLQKCLSCYLWWIFIFKRIIWHLNDLLRLHLFHSFTLLILLCLNTTAISNCIPNSERLNRACDELVLIISDHISGMLYFVFSNRNQLKQFTLHKSLHFTHKNIISLQNSPPSLIGEYGQPKLTQYLWQNFINFICGLGLGDQSKYT